RHSGGHRKGVGEPRGIADHVFSRFESMKYRACAGLRVSEIGLGCAEMGMRYGAPGRRPTRVLTDNEALTLVEKAFACGINFFDTAPGYGDSERLLGRALACLNAEAVVATKCGPFSSAQLALPRSHLQAEITMQLRRSAARLGSSRLVLLQIHNADLALLRDSPIPEVLSTLKREGSIRALGLTIYDCAAGQFAVRSGLFDAIQIPFNVLDRGMGCLLESASRMGVGVVIRSVLLKGVLTDAAQDLPEWLAALRCASLDLRRYAAM